MSIRKISFVQDEYYHVYNRGNSKQKIFHDKEDYERFVGLLYACNQNGSIRTDDLGKDQGLFSIIKNENIVSIGAWVLMPNHFHILLTDFEEGGIIKFMQKLSTAYVMYYNKKYKRTGSLFEGKFKAEHANNDRYLKYLFSYINLNPIKLIQSDWKEKGIRNKKQATEYLNNYKYSSYLDCIGVNRVQNSILNIKVFHEYFPTKKSIQSEVFDIRGSFSFIFKIFCHGRRKEINRSSSAHCSQRTRSPNYGDDSS
ncbi:MAG: transposase [Candidatus Nomurabacteria bacterium]|nr:transposase [Candidatus Nomurabacteria bacterium]